MNITKLSRVPKELQDRPQWVIWKMIERNGKPTKVPFQPCGLPAKSNDPSTWGTFAEAVAACSNRDYAGVGFMFSAEDPFCGIDLDGCWDTKTNTMSDWAKEIVLAFKSYAEISPSGTGVKIFTRAMPSVCKKVAVSDAVKVCDKEPGIEVYDRLRYFAVTGEQLKDMSAIVDGQESIEWLEDRYFPHVPPSATQVDFRSAGAVVERARKYVAKMPPAISQQRGHDKTFHVACVLMLGFQLTEPEAMSVLTEYSNRCEPPWSEKELLHKVRSADRQQGERGFLRNASPDRLPRISIPEYKEPEPTGPNVTTIYDAAKSYLGSLRANGLGLIECNMGDLDYAMGGGVEKGEMVILAARPSHGKSLCALQLVHQWSQEGRPCAIVSEEMSSLALGKRTVQFITDAPQEHWRDLVDALETDVDLYQRTHQKTFIFEACGTVDAAAKAIEDAVKNHGVECAVIDYAQLLRSHGKTRYEQVTNTSVVLRQLATSQKIVLVALCQLSRAIESRNEFIPSMGDIKESGQLEQDADVIIVLVWPYQVDKSQPKNQFQFYLLKNRNRERNQWCVEATIIPHRQKIVDQLPESNYANRPRDDERQW